MSVRCTAVLAALVLVAGLSATACTTHAGAAAQVGDTRISTTELRGLVNRGMAAAAGQQIDEATEQRNQLTYLITRELVDRVAGSLGISLSGQDVDAYRVTFAELQYGDERGLEQAAARGGIASNDLAGVIRFRAVQDAVEDRLAGTLTVPDSQVKQAYDLVKARFPALPLTLAQATPQLRRLLLERQRAVALQPRLRDEARRAGVSVSPRFGRWDVAQLAVVAADGSLSTPAPGSTPVPSGTSSLSP